MKITQILYSECKNCEPGVPSIFVSTNEGIFRLDLNVNRWRKHILVEGDSGAETDPTEDERVTLLEELSEKYLETFVVKTDKKYKNYREISEDGWKMVPCAFPTTYSYYYKNGVQKSERELIENYEEFAKQNKH